MLAAGLITFREGLEAALNVGQNWALFTLAFLAVLRDGIETALFLSAAAFSSSPLQTLIGGLLGLAAAVTLAWLVWLKRTPSPPDAHAGVS